MSTDQDHSGIHALAPLPPFLEKLLHIAESCPGHIGLWSNDGKEFEVKDTSLFEDQIVKTYFNGSLKTFIRQLHFYGFKKSEEVAGVWAFSHPSFHRDHPEWIHAIKRRTRVGGGSFAGKQEFDDLKEMMLEMKEKYEIDMASMRTQMSNLFKLIQKGSISETSSAESVSRSNAGSQKDDVNNRQITVRENEQKQSSIEIENENDNSETSGYSLSRDSSGSDSPAHSGGNGNRNHTNNVHDRPMPNEKSDEFDSEGPHGGSGESKDMSGNGTGGSSTMPASMNLTMSSAPSLSRNKRERTVLGSSGSVVGNVPKKSRKVNIKNVGSVSGPVTGTGTPCVVSSKERKENKQRHFHVGHTESAVHSVHGSSGMHNLTIPRNYLPYPGFYPPTMTMNYSSYAPAPRGNLLAAADPGNSPNQQMFGPYGQWMGMKRSPQVGTNPYGYPQTVPRMQMPSLFQHGSPDAMIMPGQKMHENRSSKRNRKLKHKKQRRSRKSEVHDVDNNEDTTTSGSGVPSLPLDDVSFNFVGVQPKNPGQVLNKQRQLSSSKYGNQHQENREVNHTTTSYHQR